MTLLLALAAVTAQPSGPAKLVIIYGSQPPAVIDYPTMARCEAARRSLLAQTKADEKPLPPNLNVPVIRLEVGAYCIPG